MSIALYIFMRSERSSSPNHHQRSLLLTNHSKSGVGTVCIVLMHRCPCTCTATSFAVLCPFRGPLKMYIYNCSLSAMTAHGSPVISLEYANGCKHNRLSTSTGAICRGSPWTLHAPHLRPTSPFFTNGPSTALHPGLVDPLESPWVRAMQLTRSTGLAKGLDAQDMTT